MNISLFEKLQNEQLIDEASLDKIKLAEANKLLSVHWELKALLYIGVLLLTGGLGVLVYKNIDTIGHQAVLAFIAAVSLGSFYYCVRNKLPFSTDKVISPNSFFDYILLLACLTFLIFIAYIQYQYNIFGNRYGMATFVPMVVLFFSAYYFDHLGILSLAITNFCAWLGLTVTPVKLLEANDFSNTTIICTGLLIGAILLIVEQISDRKNIKKHFAFTYANFGMNLLFISCLAAMFTFDKMYLLWFVLLAAFVFYFYTRSLAQKSFYFMFLTILYAYIGISFIMSKWLFSSDSEVVIEIGSLYFIASAVGFIRLLIIINRKMKSA